MSPETRLWLFSHTGDFEKENVMSQLWLWLAAAVDSLDIGVRIDPDGLW
jgi:hypothetical protein